MKQCSIIECHRKHLAKGFCKLHYVRNRRNGNPYEIKKGGAQPLNRICSIDLCNKKHTALGYCIMHYSRFKKFGNVNTVMQRRGGNYITNGYLTRTVNGKAKFVHRIIMEEYLQRPLLAGEIIHHINKNKTDNRIENLEIVDYKKHRKLHPIISKPSKNTICAISKCNKNAIARQFCSGHYHRYLRYGNPLYQKCKKGNSIHF